MGDIIRPKDTFLKLTPWTLTLVGYWWPVFGLQRIDDKMGREGWSRGFIEAGGQRVFSVGFVGFRLRSETGWSNLAWNLRSSLGQSLQSNKIPRPLDLNLHPSCHQDFTAQRLYKTGHPYPTSLGSKLSTSIMYPQVSHSLT